MKNNDPQIFHNLAKDAGNRLRSYILSVASGGTGVFVISLTASREDGFSGWEKFLLVSALLFFVSTVLLCLYELRIDAKRFFNLAKQHEIPEGERSWDLNKKLKRKRYVLIHASYATLSLGALCITVYLVIRILGS
jgi:hypothetical protein